MKKKLIFKVVILVIILITVYILITTIETIDFDLQFDIVKNESTIDLEKVIFKGKLVKFPVDIYYIRGNLIIDKEIYIVNSYKRESDQVSLSNDTFIINLLYRDKQEFISGYARLLGDITNDSVQSMYISIDIMHMETGFSYSEYINCYIIK